MSNRMKARAIKDLLYSWCLKILWNYTRLEVCAILRDFFKIPYICRAPLGPTENRQGEWTPWINIIINITTILQIINCFRTLTIIFTDNLLSIKPHISLYKHYIWNFSQVSSSPERTFFPVPWVRMFSGQLIVLSWKSHVNNTWSVWSAAEQRLFASCYTYQKYVCALRYTYQHKRGQGQPSGESTCLPPMGPELESWSRRHQWVEFVVDSRLFPRIFPPNLQCSSIYKTLLNSSSIWTE